MLEKLRKSRIRQNGGFLIKKRAIGVGGAVPHQDFQEGSVFFLKQAIPF